MKHRNGYISRAELLEVALRDPDFRARYQSSTLPFAQLLTEMRAKAGLTQEQLANKSGFGRPLISMLESGTLTNTKWGTMAAIAEACGFRLILTAGEIERGAPDAEMG